MRRRDRVLDHGLKLLQAFLQAFYGPLMTFGETSGSFAFVLSALSREILLKMTRCQMFGFYRRFLRLHLATTFQTSWFHQIYPHFQARVDGFVPLCSPDCLFDHLNFRQPDSLVLYSSHLRSHRALFGQS